MFIRELSLYVDHLRKEIEEYSMNLSSRVPKYFREFKDNLLSGIEYYRSQAQQFIDDKGSRFLDDLRALHETIEGMAQVVPSND